METLKLPVILCEGEDGYVVAQIPLIPGCISQGKTLAEALENIKEAAGLSLENRVAECWELPHDYSVQQIEVSAG
jgi:predicted RNase H-like HicB family nuclease